VRCAGREVFHSLMVRSPATARTCPRGLKATTVPSALGRERPTRFGRVKSRVSHNRTVPSGPAMASIFRPGPYATAPDTDSNLMKWPGSW
jgi:hypothetical protein